MSVIVGEVSLSMTHNGPSVCEVTPPRGHESNAVRHFANAMLNEVPAKCVNMRLHE